MSQKKPKGPVMVLGGGIAGIQTALSLSEAGYGVQLIEHTGLLGGMMPNLHRIYPLCACCKVDPQIAVCEQDPNINVMLNSKVVAFSGKVGNFTVIIETGNNKKELTVGAVILAGGIETFNPAKHKTYAYSQLPNVISSVEYEQMQKPLGLDAGMIKRPSDGKIPEKIAWLQCVGSRDNHQCDIPYCSSVCCMYALKEALNTKDFKEDIEATIFFMDMRTHGKDYEDYLNAAIAKDVRLIRSRIHSVGPLPETDDLLIGYVDEGGLVKQEIYDMVILSVGIRPAGHAIEVAKRMGVSLTDEQFISTEPFKPVSTNIPGVFVCGGLSGPNDIKQSIVQASASVSEVASILMPEPFFASKKYPDIADIEGKESEVLFAYHLCPGMEPDLGVKIERYAMKAPGVKAVLKVDDDIISCVTERLIETGTNRLVFASCTPAIHQSLIEESLKLASLNPYLYDLVDLRAIDSQTSSTQLQDRIRMGAARALLLSPPSLREIQVVKTALVVGGGITGLESALSVAKKGYAVTVVEKEKELGGHALHVRKTWQGYDAKEYLKELITSVNQEKKITVMTETQVKENRGSTGIFVTVLDQKGERVEILHGVTILAPGGNPIRPQEYLLGQHKKVYLWSDLENEMMEDPSSIEGADTVAFIQCVGSRDVGCSHCSNICCTFSVRTAVDLKTRNPDMNIYILYRDMRTFGERELLYKEAREKGVVFIRYDLDNMPVVKSIDSQDGLYVEIFDKILQKTIAFDADFVSLQTAIKGTNNQELSDIFGINLDSNGFFAESPEKLRPVDASTKGIFIAGLAVYPKDMLESIAQAKAASARALEILTQDTIKVGGMVAEVMAEKCAVCCTCVRTCPFNVPFIDHETGVACIDPGLCQGCGMCVAECPGKAIFMLTCSDQMLTKAPSILLG